MTYRISVQTVAPLGLAAVRRRLTIPEIAGAFRPAIEALRPLLAKRPDLNSDGRIVLLYHHPVRREDVMSIDFGVHVSRPFEAEGEVFYTETPAGQAATTTHVGRYEALRDAHDAIHAWREGAGRGFDGLSWEIYGAFNADPALNETQIMYRLA